MFFIPKYTPTPCEQQEGQRIAVPLFSFFGRFTFDIFDKVTGLAVQQIADSF